MGKDALSAFSAGPIGYQNDIQEKLKHVSLQILYVNVHNQKWETIQIPVSR